MLDIGKLLLEHLLFLCVEVNLLSKVFGFTFQLRNTLLQTHYLLFERTTFLDFSVDIFSINVCSCVNVILPFARLPQSIFNGQILNFDQLSRVLDHCLYMELAVTELADLSTSCLTTTHVPLLRTAIAHP